MDFIDYNFSKLCFRCQYIYQWTLWVTYHSKSRANIEEGDLSASSFIALHLLRSSELDEVESLRKDFFFPIMQHLDAKTAGALYFRQDMELAKDYFGGNIYESRHILWHTPPENIRVQQIQALL